MVCWWLQCSTTLWGSLEVPRLGLIGVSPFRDHLDFFGLGASFIFLCARRWWPCGVPSAMATAAYAVTLPGPLPPDSLPSPSVMSSPDSRVSSRAARARDVEPGLESVMSSPDSRVSSRAPRARDVEPGLESVEPVMSSPSSRARTRECRARTRECRVEYLEPVMSSPDSKV